METQTVAKDMRSLLIASASSAVRNQIRSIEIMANFSLHHFQSDGSLDANGALAGYNFSQEVWVHADYAMSLLKGNDWMAMIDVSLYTNQT